MENPKLTGKQRTHLRGLGQKLDSALSVGRGGVTKTVLNELERLLASHELVKVRVLAERDDRPAITELLATGTRSEIVGSVGKTVLLYRAAPNLGANRIHLPAASHD
ncbi:MAG TPA: YhbY family RNA-binding protein [Opitutaceae bacterium]|nr:YhbY family RNA-binding protein [Opitutaceae bacterium]